jgi:hypothetical protein
MFHSPERIRESGGRKDVFRPQQKCFGRKFTVFGPNRDGSKTAFSSENAHTKTILYSYNAKRSIRRLAPQIFRTHGRHVSLARESSGKWGKNDLFDHGKSALVGSSPFSVRTEMASKPHFRQRTPTQKLFYTRTTSKDLFVDGLRCALRYKVEYFHVAGTEIKRVAFAPTVRDGTETRNASFNGVALFARSQVQDVYPHGWLAQLCRAPNCAQRSAGTQA